MKPTKLLTAMLLLPTLALAQTANVDPSLRKVPPAQKQTIGFTSGQLTGVSGGNTMYMLVGSPVSASMEQFVAQTSAVSGRSRIYL